MYKNEGVAQFATKTRTLKKKKKLHLTVLACQNILWNFPFVYDFPGFTMSLRYVWAMLAPVLETDSGGQAELFTVSSIAKRPRGVGQPVFAHVRKEQHIDRVDPFWAAVWQHNTQQR